MDEEEVLEDEVEYCPDCDGSGDDGEGGPCPNCDGSGEVWA